MIFTTILSVVLFSSSIFGQDTCPLKDANGIYKIVIDAPSPVENIHLMNVHLDSSTKMPLASTVLYGKLNANKDFDRADDFRRYPCAYNDQTACEISFKMLESQKISSGWLAWDRGHLTPVNPMRFSADAILNTFFCLNMGAQEPYTNRGPWATVENQTHYFHSYIKKLPGYVMTGLCSAPEPTVNGITKEGYKVPACYWKLTCYKENRTGSVRVVGFIGPNGIFNKSDQTLRSARDKSTTQVRSQNDILAVLSDKDKPVVEMAWKEAAINLNDLRGETDLPTAAECIAAISMPDSVKSEWEKYMDSVPPRAVY